MLITNKMEYKETLNWMYNKLPMYQRIGGAAYKANLDNTIKLLSLLGDPYKKFKSVHVAGTNGKGSISHMIASVFQEAGYKTGLYTSPHLIDFRERIRINGEMIPQEKVVNFIAKHKEEFEDIGLSFFEMTVGMAFDYFANENIDIAIVEVGMGGRLDSTNLITPELSVITNIGLDHVKFLGDTLEKIAHEKAGIIKPGIPVVIGETQAETKKVFIDTAKERGCNIIFADSIFECKKIETLQNFDSQQFDIWKDCSLYIDSLRVPMLGHYQKKNVTTAVCALDKLSDKFKLTIDDIKNGIEHTVTNTHLMGRWQILGREPLIIADTGHNADGIREVSMQLAQLKCDKLHIVLGVVNDKDIDNMLIKMPSSAEYYFCKADIPRGLDAEKLAEEAFKYGLRGKVYSSVTNALTSAKNNACFNDAIFIGGSNFTVAEVI